MVLNHASRDLLIECDPQWIKEFSISASPSRLSTRCLLEVALRVENHCCAESELEQCLHA